MILEYWYFSLDDLAAVPALCSSGVITLHSHHQVVGEEIEPLKKAKEPHMGPSSLSSRSPTQHLALVTYLSPPIDQMDLA